MSTRARVLFFLIAWAIVLMPFLFWRSTWFGRQLTDQQLTQYLHDDQHPRHIQHALVQIGERISRRDAGVARWYPDLVRLSTYPVEEIRNTDAWVMGQDTSRPEFHRALLIMLQDSSPNVRSNAALALVRFGDAIGRPQLVSMLEPVRIVAPQAGRVVDTAKPGSAIHEGGVVAKLEAAGTVLDLRAPISGRIRSIAVQKDAQVTTGAELAVLDPASDQVWEALRALYLVGQREDLPAVVAYQRDLPDMPDRIRQQAVLTEKAILGRAKP
jgi:biotin carboxyl carrier protein